MSFKAIVAKVQKILAQPQFRPAEQWLYRAVTAAVLAYLAAHYGVKVA